MSTSYRLICLDCDVAGDDYQRDERNPEKLELLWRHRHTLAALGRCLVIVSDHLPFDQLGVEHDDHDVRVISEYGELVGACARCGHRGYDHLYVEQGGLLRRTGRCEGPWITDMLNPSDREACDCPGYEIPPRPSPRTRDEVLPEVSRILRGAQPDRGEQLVIALERLLAVPLSALQVRAVGDQIQVMARLGELSDEQRLEIFRQFCRYCGSVDPSCHCINDE